MASRRQNVGNTAGSEDRFRPPALLWVGVWLLGVSVLGFATWRIVDAAGREAFLNSRESTTFEQATPTAPGRSTGGQPRPQAATRSPGAPRTETAAPPPATTAPSAAPTLRAPAVSSSASPEPAATPAPSRAVSETKSVSAGRVSVTCRGAVISLDGATPANGFTMEVEISDERVEVEFEPQDERSEVDDVKVRASCAAGRPVFRVE